MPRPAQCSAVTSSLATGGRPGWTKLWADGVPTPAGWGYGPPICSMSVGSSNQGKKAPVTMCKEKKSNFWLCKTEDLMLSPTASRKGSLSTLERTWDGVRTSDAGAGLAINWLHHEGLGITFPICPMGIRRVFISEGYCEALLRWHPWRCFVSCGVLSRFNSGSCNEICQGV